MDMDFSEEQMLLKTSAREFLDRECPATLVRQMERDAHGFPAELWKQMAALGWLGLPFAEAYGGSGLDLVTLSALLEEFGRVGDPTPYFNTVVACGLTVQAAGNERQKRDLLPPIAAGDLLMTIALAEPGGAYT